jgi:putative spermidine/putrescine transport system substrate-binding protein
MTLELTRRRLLATSGGLLGSAALAGLIPGRTAWAQQRSGVVNTYGGRWEKFWREQLIPPFEKQYATKTTLDVGLSKTWTANLRAAGADKPPYDVIMFNEVFANLMRGEGYFEPWPLDKVPNARDLYPIAQNDMTGLFGLISPIAIAYRTDMVKTPPKRWTDLWENKEFKGKIGMYQIGNSAGYMFLLLASKLFGKSEYDTDVGFKKIEELLPFPQVDFSGTMGIQMSRGEIAIGALDLPEVAAMKRKGVPVDYVLPPEGVFMFEQSFNLLKGSKNKDFAYDYMNFVLDPDIQQKLAIEFFVSPTNSKVKIPAEYQKDIPISGEAMNSILKWDWKVANERRDAVTDRWNRTIRS